MSSASAIRFRTIPADAVDGLVSRGCARRLQSANLITGQMLVALEFVPDAPPARSTAKDGAFVRADDSNAGGFAGIAGVGRRAAATRSTRSRSPDRQNLDEIMQGLNDIANGPQLEAGADHRSPRRWPPRSDAYRSSMPA